MATYKVIAFCSCSGCHGVHEIDACLSLDDGPAIRQSIGDFYNCKELPPELVTLHGIYSPCPRTGRYFCQTDTYQCFLVPVPSDDRPQEHNHQRQGRSERPGSSP